MVKTIIDGIDIYLWSVSHSQAHKTISVQYGPGALVGEESHPIAAEIVNVTIDGPEYEELVSASPAWAPNKPAGSFNEDDLLAFSIIAGPQAKDRKEREVIERNEAESEDGEKRKKMRQQIKQTKIKQSEARAKKRKTEQDKRRADRIAKAKKRDVKEMMLRPKKGRKPNRKPLERTES